MGRGREYEMRESLVSRKRLWERYAKLRVALALGFCVVMGVVFGGCPEEREGSGEGEDQKSTEGKRERKRREGSRRKVKERRRRRRRGGRRRRRRGRRRWKKPPQALVKPGSWGKVVHVVDADTIYLRMEDGKKTFVKARLAGINAPECHKKRVRLPSGKFSAQCNKDDEFFGLRSFHIMKKIVGGKRLRVKCDEGKDGFCKCGSYGRPLLSFQREGKDVGELLLERGGGWAYTKYNHPELARYCRAEDKGRKAKKGMWKRGSRKKVMAKMSKKTRRWYKHRDKVCRKALKR